MFLSKTADEIFKVIETPLNYSTLTEEEWQTIRFLADDRIVIKKYTWALLKLFVDRVDYLKEANKQLSNKNV